MLKGLPMLEDLLGYFETHEKEIYMGPNNEIVFPKPPMYTIQQNTPSSGSRLDESASAHFWEWTCFRPPPSPRVVVGVRRSVLVGSLFNGVMDLVGDTLFKLESEWVEGCGRGGGHGRVGGKIVDINSEALSSSYPSSASSSPYSSSRICMKTRSTPSEKCDELLVRSGQARLSLPRGNVDEADPRSWTHTRHIPPSLYMAWTHAVNVCRRTSEEEADDEDAETEDEAPVAVKNL
ncbi:hypothetical protein EV361DRAFT_978358 [Lentinula raphanica]|nr:hypothetical protein EV361DRAFT_978358 [Lentinula raphanica]